MLAHQHERGKCEYHEEKTRRGEGALLVSLADDQLSDDGESENDTDEAEGDREPRHAPVLLRRSDIGEQRVILGEGELSERHGRSAHDENRQDAVTRRHDAEQGAGAGREDREPGEEGLTPAKLVGDRAGEWHRDQQEGDDTDLRHAHPSSRACPSRR